LFICFSSVKYATQLLYASQPFLHSSSNELLENLFVCSISTIVGTNGLNSADVPLSNKQTDKILLATVKPRVSGNMRLDFHHLVQHFASPKVSLVMTTNI